MRRPFLFELKTDGDMDETHPATRLNFGSRRRRFAALVLNVIFFACIAWWLQRNVKLDDLLGHLRQIPPGAILLAMAMNSIVVFLFGLRLATILGAKILPCCLIMTIGMTFNSLLPFRLGEGVKIYCGNTIFHLPLGCLGAAVVMEKLYDLTMLLGLIVIVTTTANASVVAFSRPAILTLAITLPFCAMLILRARSGRGIAPPSARALLKKFGLDRAAAEAVTLFAHQNLARPAVLSLLIWTTNIALVLFFFRAVTPEIGFSLLDAMNLMVIASLAIALPVSPAGLGVFEAGIAAYLTSFHGVPTEKAISAALAIHFSITTPHSVIAALFFVFMFMKSLKAKA